MSDAIVTDAQATHFDEAAPGDEPSAAAGISAVAVPPVAAAASASGQAPVNPQIPAFRPLLDLIPGMPSGQVCGPDGCAPGE